MNVFLIFTVLSAVAADGADVQLAGVSKTVAATKDEHFIEDASTVKEVETPQDAAEKIEPMSISDPDDGDERSAHDSDKDDIYYDIQGPKDDIEETDMEENIDNGEVNDPKAWLYFHQGKGRRRRRTDRRRRYTAEYFLAIRKIRNSKDAKA